MSRVGSRSSYDESVYHHEAEVQIDCGLYATVHCLALGSVSLAAVIKSR